jgi:hypothetical protein
VNIGANGLGQERHAIESGKDRVNEQICECVRHSFAPLPGAD